MADRAKAVWAENYPHLLSRTTIVGGSFLEKGAQQFCAAPQKPAASRLTGPCIRGLAAFVICLRAPMDLTLWLLARRWLWHAGSVPEAASSKTVYVLREVLHDWNDDSTMTILRHVRAAIGAAPPLPSCRACFIVVSLVATCRCSAPENVAKLSASRLPRAASAGWP